MVCTPAPASIQRQHISIKEYPPATSICVTPHTHLEMFMVEIGRGCGRGCRFCAAGHAYHPFRYWPLQQIVDEVARYALPGDRIGLVGAALSDFKDLDLLCDELLRRDHKISLSSLRADRISGRLLAALAASDIRSVTLAPEAGTERLRSAIRKNLDEEQILDAVGRIAGSQIRQLKLYYMIGLPSEQPDDLAAIITLTRKIAQIFIRKRGGREVRVSINAFVPKPWTPFQWAAMATEQEIKRKRNPLILELNRIEGVSAGRKSGREEVQQALLAIGDSNVGEGLARAVDQGEEWQTIYPRFAEWIHRPKQLGEELPWDFIDNGLEKERLWRGWMAGN